jgi:hypothetical protein
VGRLRVDPLAFEPTFHLTGDGAVEGRDEMDVSPENGLPSSRACVVVEAGRELRIHRRLGAAWIATPRFVRIPELPP